MVKNVFVCTGQEPVWNLEISPHLLINVRLDIIILYNVWDMEYMSWITNTIAHCSSVYFFAGLVTCRGLLDMNVQIYWKATLFEIYSEFLTRVKKMKLFKSFLWDSASCFSHRLQTTSKISVYLWLCQAGSSHRAWIR